METLAARRGNLWRGTEIVATCFGSNRKGAADSQEVAAEIARACNAFAEMPAGDEEHPIFRQGFLAGWNAAKKRCSELVAEAFAKGETP